jgi:ubiquinone/menaquinone biosynthesis C-methylase UbiE
MSRINDPAYLQHAQYKTSTNLAARIEVHRRFSVNPYGWLTWVFDALHLQPGIRVLEVGGGPGVLWRENAARLPADLAVCFSDFSPGMVAEARSALDADARFTFVNADVQAIPSPTAAFNVVIANHMLYHVPDLAQGVRELARVLRPGGRLFAATNGLNHMRDLQTLVSEFDARHTPVVTPDQFARAFGLENAPEILGRAFARVEVQPYDDALWVTEAQPLTDYVLSMGWGDAREIDPARAEAFTAFLRAKIEADGGLRIRKESGLAIGYK